MPSPHRARRSRAWRAAEAKVAAARERAREAVRSRAAQATEWMAHVVADVPALDATDEGVLGAVLERLEHASASVGISSGRLAVTLTVEASCKADAERIGGWMVLAAIAASGLDASWNVRAEVEYAED